MVDKAMVQKHCFMSDTDPTNTMQFSTKTNTFQITKQYRLLDPLVAQRFHKDMLEQFGLLKHRLQNFKTPESFV
jgi:hypothetical protein